MHSVRHFNIPATMLDSWAYFLHSDMDVQEFIDRLNGRQEPSPQADKGRLFNQLIDDILAGNEVEMIGDVYRVREYGFAKYLVDDIVKSLLSYGFEPIPQLKLYKDIEVVKTLGERYTVTIYGVIDYLVGSTCIDLKTTSRYEFGKYRYGFQHKIYPIILSESFVKIENFIYMATDFKNVYKEEYPCDENKIREYELDVKQDIGHLIDFILDHQGEIDNTKIFDYSHTHS